MITVRSLGSLKASIGLAAFRAIPMNSLLPRRCSGGASVGRDRHPREEVLGVLEVQGLLEQTLLTTQVQGRGNVDLLVVADLSVTCQTVNGRRSARP